MFIKCDCFGRRVNECVVDGFAVVQGVQHINHIINCADIINLIKFEY